MTRKLVTYIRSIRWFEIGVRMGAPVIAILLAMPSTHHANLIKGLFLLVAFGFLWAHGYTLNEWGGYQSDLSDPFKKKRPVVAGEISHSELLNLSIILVIISIVLFTILDPNLLIIVFADIVIGILYCHPAIDLKTVPFLSFLSLFIVSINDFLLGWFIFSQPTVSGIMIALFFGLLGLSGIAYHEVGDFESDKRSNIKTNAVRFGKKFVFISGFVFYCLAVVYFVLLNLLDILPKLFYPIFLITFPLYAYIFFVAMRSGLDSISIHSFIRRYRILYVVIGIYMVTILALDLL